MVVETPHRAKQSKPHPIYDGTEADPLLPQPVSLPWIYFVALCIVVIITADMANSLVQAPRIRLYESIVCTRYYAANEPSLVGKDGSVPEELCKLNLIQDEITMVLGWQIMFENVPSILLAIPYGSLAEMYGRKWILVLALASNARNSVHIKEYRTSDKAVLWSVFTGISQLYAIIGATEDLGSLLSGPCFSFTFHIGLKYGTAWQGMPFLVSTTLLVGVAVVVFFAQTEK